MVNVFCRLAHGEQGACNYAVMNDKCINFYIQMKAMDILVDENWRYEKDTFYNLMFRDIYKIYWDCVITPIPMTIYLDCVDRAGNAIADIEGNKPHADEEREAIVMGAVCYLLEMVQPRKDFQFTCFLNRLQHFYGAGDEYVPNCDGEFLWSGQFYHMLHEVLDPIKDNPQWCADPRELAQKTPLERTLEAMQKAILKGDICDPLPQELPPPMQVAPAEPTASTPLPSNESIFVDVETEKKWTARVKAFIADHNVTRPLDGSIKNPALAMIHLFYKAWTKQKNILHRYAKDTAILDFFVAKCGVQVKVQKNGKPVASKTLTNKLSELKSEPNLLGNTDEIMRLKEEIKKLVMR